MVLTRSMHIDSVFADMLKECGVTATDPEADARDERHRLELALQEHTRVQLPATCCGEYVTGYTGDMQPVCFVCGVVQAGVTVATTAEPTHRAEHSIKPLYASARKRFYQPLTHFRDLLRRYQGNGDVTPHDNIARLIGPVNLQDRWLYYTIKGKLKALGCQRFYKSIFQIIHAIGGKRCTITHQ